MRDDHDAFAAAAAVVVTPAKMPCRKGAPTAGSAVRVVVCTWSGAVVVTSLMERNSSVSGSSAAGW